MGTDGSFGSISVSGQLPTYPSPNPTLTLTCYQLTVVELGEGKWAVAQILILICSFLGHRLQLRVSHNILWVTELSKPAMILVKN